MQTIATDFERVSGVRKLKKSVDDCRYYREDVRESEFEERVVTTAIGACGNGSLKWSGPAGGANSIGARQAGNLAASAVEVRLGPKGLVKRKFMRGHEEG